MSRSVKKISCFKNEESCKFGQRRANKKVRHYCDNIPKGGHYKKIFNSWDICDYKFIDFEATDYVDKRK